MPAIEVKPGVYWIGVNDRTTNLFEGLWPIDREGVSYNAYLIDGDKKAIVDMSRDFKADELLDQIAQLVDPLDLDYIVINHMEPDHTGVLRTLRRIAPKTTILGTKKALDFLDAFYHITEGVRAVSDGEVLDLGSHKLRFVTTPFVHWPETMMTYEVEHQILFSCDGFGGYGALQGGIFDDQYEDLSFYEQEALRYYTNIVALYPKPVLKAIAKLADVPVSVVAPSHGLIWRKHPERIIALYEAWARYAGAAGDLGVTLLYGTMYGMTEHMVEAVAEGVAQAGVPVEIFDVSRTHVGYILPYLYTRCGVLVGAPTYEGGIFPTMANVLQVLEHKRLFNKKSAYFGSYGWSGGAERDFKKFAESLRWDFADSFVFRGGADHAVLRDGMAFGYRFAESLKEA